MANGTKIGDLNISYFKVGGSDCSIYLGNTLVYPTSPSSQTPCFAVVDDISDYTDTDFVDVFESSTDKWYKLNNLNEYEEYGVYGEGRNITYYDGKLTIDGDYEYEWNGSSWVNLGEVSGYTIHSPEYLERSASANGYLPLGETFQLNTTIEMNFQMTQAKGFAIIGDNFASDSTDWRMFLNYDSGQNNLLSYDFLNTRIQYNTGNWSKKFNLRIGNYYIDDIETGTRLMSGTKKTSFTRPNQLYLFNLVGTTPQQNTDYGHIYNTKIYQDGTMVKDYIPWTDGNGTYGMWDRVSNQSVPSIGQMTGSSVVHDVVVESDYPEYYTEKTEPENNVVFNDMTEALAYECPWVGMNAFIGGDKYIFTSAYTWEYDSSRLPSGYTEVEYIQNYVSTSDSINNLAYLDTMFIPNHNTRTVATIKIDKATTNPRIFGFGFWNSLAYMVSCENTIGASNSYIYYKFGDNSTWYTTTINTNLMKHTYDLNNNGNLVIDDNVIASLPTTSFTGNETMAIFTSKRSGSTPIQYTEVMYGKMYSFKVYDNGTLVRDFVPCIRDVDDVAGAYDTINNVFYGSANNNRFVAGAPI